MDMSNDISTGIEPQYQGPIERLGPPFDSKVGKYFSERNIQYWSVNTHPNVDQFLADIKKINSFNSLDKSISGFCYAWIQYLSKDMVDLYRQLQKSKAMVQVRGQALQVEGQEVAQQVVKSQLVLTKVLANVTGKRGREHIDEDRGHKQFQHQPQSRTPSPRRLPESPVPFPRLTKEGSCSSLSESESSTCAHVGNDNGGFDNDESPRDQVLNAIAEGQVLPAWARDCHDFTFRMNVGGVSYGAGLTEAYNENRLDGTLNWEQIPKIALLSGIMHWYDGYPGHSNASMAQIRNTILRLYYTEEQEKADLIRARAATVKWNEWIAELQQLASAEQLAADDEGRRPKPVNTLSIVRRLMTQEFDFCEKLDILPVLFAAITFFRKLDNWDVILSELDLTVSLLWPLLGEFLSVQHTIRYTIANSATQAGKARKVRMGNTSNGTCRPDIIGLINGGQSEAFYGEVKLAGTSKGEQAADRLRLAIFSKDLLDQLRLENRPRSAVLTFQAVGTSVVPFLGAQVNNTIVHLKLGSAILVPSLLKNLQISENNFCLLFKCRTLVQSTELALTDDCSTPLEPADETVATMWTPSRKAALGKLESGGTNKKG